MIKKLRVTVDGKPYEVTVELSDESESTSSSAPAPAAPPPPVIAAPAPKPAAAPPAPAPTAAAVAPGVAGPGSVVSPLAGLVVQIAVTIGQQVSEGDRVFTLEAMKMNTGVNAPKSGKVTEIKVAVGDAASEGQVLAVIS